MDALAEGAIMAPSTSLSCPYSTDQIDQYLHHISLPPKYDVAVHPRDVNLLAALQRHHLSSIPFENLSLHYSPTRQIPLDPQSVFTKFITHHRGGYCMEQNVFYAHMLRGLGFTVYCAGARVRKRVNGIPVGDYMGWSHLVNIVTLDDGSRYVVDVGFGGDGPNKPHQLLSGEEYAQYNMGTQQMHLMHENIASNADPGQRLWIYSIRNHPQDAWKACYCFTETEFLQQDFEVMSWFVNTCPASWFTMTVVAVKMILDPGKEEIVGKTMLWGTEVKENTGGRTRLLMMLKSEEERVEVLRKKFGIVLSREEVEAIRGTIVALPYMNDVKYSRAFVLKSEAFNLLSVLMS